MNCNANKKPTPQELHAALKLIELLYLRGEIPHHVYRNILADYYGQDISILATPCHPIGDTEQVAI
ncbi:MAG: hypothetical protein IKN55_12470 [Oscillospiraceae bacterium]|nr:hypothetical protein [Oscillospiraceae bacterium]